MPVSSRSFSSKQAIKERIMKTVSYKKINRYGSNPSFGDEKEAGGGKPFAARSLLISGEYTRLSIKLTERDGIRSQQTTLVLGKTYI